MCGHFSGSLRYADDIRLLSPSMYGLKTLNKLGNLAYATELDFNCYFAGVYNVYLII